ncbi:MAG: thiamine-phosphate pyrophosphorylase, partial [Acidobacteriota bacterium]|jgi:thiamine-phosphate pyrophosphorylase|nr:thiamine-phosphate pyrophosphorylase [Acidobacteriota bacterium]
MSQALARPITYLITSGESSSATTPSSEEFCRLLALVRAAVNACVTLVQLREKELNGRVLFELASAAAQLARGSATRVLVNDRADVARAAGCDGVHLTTSSLDASTVRRVFGEEFLIGVSAHTLQEARTARDGGADFAVFGPVYDTPSKRAYGPPAGLGTLMKVALELSPFPLVALGGVSVEQVKDVLQAGAAGVAGIRLFANGQNLVQTVHLIRRTYDARGVLDE